MDKCICRWYLRDIGLGLQSDILTKLNASFLTKWDIIGSRLELISHYIRDIDIYEDITFNVSILE